MKILLNSKIYGMSVSRQDANKQIDAQSEPFIEHLSKIILYGDIKEDYISDWVKLMAKSIFNIKDITIKPRGKKPKDSDISYHMTHEAGDNTTDDINNVLIMWKTKLTRLSVNPYPDIQITYDMVSRMQGLIYVFRNTLPGFIKSCDKSTTLTDCIRYVNSIL